MGFFGFPPEDSLNASPPLHWFNPPPGTKSFVVVMEETGASGRVHWLLYDIPGDTRFLQELIDSVCRQGPAQGTLLFKFWIYG